MVSGIVMAASAVGGLPAPAPRRPPAARRDLRRRWPPVECESCIRCVRRRRRWRYGQTPGDGVSIIGKQLAKLAHEFQVRYSACSRLGHVQYFRSVAVLIVFLIPPLPLFPLPPAFLDFAECSFGIVRDPQIGISRLLRVKAGEEAEYLCSMKGVEPRFRKFREGDEVVLSGEMGGGHSGGFIRECRVGSWSSKGQASSVSPLRRFSSLTLVISSLCLILPGKAAGQNPRDNLACSEPSVQHLMCL